MHIFAKRYPISFWNDRAISAVGNFATNLVAIATSLEIMEKEVQIDHLHPKCFRLVKRLRKAVQQILR